jgi:hypothetical protein
MRTNIILAGLLICGWLVPLSAAEPEWKIGLAQVKITPEQPVHLAGYANRNKPYEKITSNLFAKALALQDRTGRKAVLVTTDLIGLSAAVAEPVCERIRERCGLERDQILLNSSHTHTGPALSLTARAGDTRPAGDAQRTIAYTRQLQDKLVEIVAQALDKLEPAQLSWGTGVAHFVVNRREFTANGVKLGHNPRGPADRTVPVLRIDGPDGKLRGVLYGAATHNTTLTGQCYEVCGDYAGFSQEFLQQRFPGAQAMFMLGLAGDSDPYPRGTMDLAREHGATLGKEVSRVLEGKLQPVRGPLTTVFGRVDLPLQPTPPREQLEKQAANKRDSLQATIAQQMLRRLDRGEKLPDHYTCPVAVWQFGKDLTVVGLSGEVVVDYVALIEKAVGPLQLWPIAYCNDVFGYLPSARVLAEGGYETRGLTTGLGKFAPNAQDVLVAKVRELAEKAGRPLPATGGK